MKYWKHLKGIRLVKDDLSVNMISKSLDLLNGHIVRTTLVKIKIATRF